MISCQRCARQVRDPDDLETHLRTDHLMAPAQARRETRQTFNGSAPTNGHTLAAEPSREPGPGHACPKCGTPIECRFEVVLRAEHDAKAMVITANALKAKLLGTWVGKRRNADFTDEEARRAVEELGSVNRAARKLGVGWSTVKAAAERAGATEFLERGANQHATRNGGP